MEKRIINLPRGGSLEVDCTTEFYDVVRESLNIDGHDISDDELMSFIYSAFKIGIDKAEIELKEKGKLTQGDE